MRSIEKATLPIPLRATLRRALPLLLAGAAALASTPGAYAIVGGRVHTLEGPVLGRGSVLVRDGRITAVGADLAVPPDAEVIDAAGLEVSPGFFDALDTLGLQEIGAVKATVDTTDLGECNPQLRAATAVHPESELIPIARAAGVTLTLTVPGLFAKPALPGQAAVLRLRGRNLEDLAVQPAAAMVLNWPTLETRSFDLATFKVVHKPFADVKKEQEKRVQDLDALMDRARHYADAADAGPVDRDLKLEALVPVVRGRQPVLVLAQRSREILQAVDFCRRNHLRMILGGGAEAWKVKTQLKDLAIPVILARTLNLPPNPDDPYDRAMTLPAELQEAGLTVAIGMGDPAFSRQLPQQAGVAAAYGLSQEDALRTITLNPARILGLDADYGSLRAGKVADLVLTAGDPLEVASAVKQVFIQGRPVSLGNRHQELYERYKGSGEVK